MGCRSLACIIKRRTKDPHPIVAQVISCTFLSGKAEQIAVLEFSKDRANWVADERWHAEQRGEWLENGKYQLSIPFSDSRELVMDILKYGAEVTVIAPEFLRVSVQKKIAKMQKNYHCFMK